MRRKTISSEMILEATISLAARNGLETVTARKVADSLGISEGSIYNNFPNKTELLDNCLYYVERDIDKMLDSAAAQTQPASAADKKRTLRTLWFAYFEYFMSHRDYAKFYRQFRMSSYYENVESFKSSKPFAFFRALVGDASCAGVNCDICWTFIIEATLNFAIDSADKNIPSTPEDIERMYAMISRGTDGMFESVCA